MGIRLFTAALLMAMVALAPTLHAREATSPPADVLTSGFLHGHPDLKHRLRGMHRYEQGRYQEALEEFMQAARWADKFAQGMVGEMHWMGTVAGADRAAAYAWMDLAAERGYPGLLAKRERYWSELDDSERERAVAIGEELYARYGDDVAKPRLARRMRSERRKLTGSRTGFVGALKVLVPSAGGWTQLDGSQFYNPRYWDPDKYFAWQDRIGRLPPQGVVRVGPLLQEDDPAEQELRGDAGSDQ